jgi:hypothetical protein
MACFRLVARLVASATVFALIACSHGSSTSTSSTTTTTTVPVPTSLLTTPAGTYAGTAAALSVVQNGSNLSGTNAGSPTADILTVTLPTSAGASETVILSSTAPGGGAPITLSFQGSGTQSGLASQNYQGPFTSLSTNYNFTVNDVTAAAGLNYSSFGQWSVSTSGTTTNTSIGFYSVGSPTPIASVPTSGSATYNGTAIGVAVLNTSTVGYYFNGIATLTAIFGSNTISGGVSNINAYSTGTTSTAVGSLNAITFSSGTISGNGFSGAAATSSTAGSATNLSGATGFFRGNFFGPAAQEAGGTFNLTNTTTNAVITGSFGTHK